KSAFSSLGELLGTQGITVEIEIEDLTFVRLILERCGGGQSLAGIEQIKAVVAAFLLFGSGQGTSLSVTLATIIPNACITLLRTGIFYSPHTTSGINQPALCVRTTSKAECSLPGRAALGCQRDKFYAMDSLSPRERGQSYKGRFLKK